MIEFLRAERRWLGAGLLLTYASAFGQTWFISLFAGDVMAAAGLSDGGWGLVYTAATLLAAGGLFLRGALADTMRLGRLAPAIALLFAASALLLALSGPVWTLLLAVLGLRFCGQGMFSHIALTAMGRWFRARRGRAVAIVTLGYSLAEVSLVLPAVLARDALGWRASLAIAAAILGLLVAPALAALLARDRAPASAVEAAAPGGGLGGRDWTRRDVIGHWLFWALLPFLLTPGFIGTVIFFHQVHIAEVKGWTMAQMAGGYPFYSGLTIAAALAGGWAVDRFGSAALVPVLLLPMGLGALLIGPAAHPAAWYLAFALTGLTQGLAVPLWGALLPECYGSKHLGAVRSLATTLMVVSTAAGPGVTGLLIDRGLDFPRQAGALGLWCLGLCLAGIAIRRRLAREAAAG